MTRFAIPGDIGHLETYFGDNRQVSRFRRPDETTRSMNNYDAATIDISRWLRYLPPIGRTGTSRTNF